MDGIANVARQQQTQIQDTQVHSKDESKPLTTVVNEKLQEKAQEEKKLDENDTKSLVDKLNKEMEVLGTDLKFGVDKHDTFYVSVIDKKTNEVIRRWPAEKAEVLLPKMKEVTGLLFDTKG